MHLLELFANLERFPMLLVELLLELTGASQLHIELPLRDASSPFSEPPAPVQRQSVCLPSRLPDATSSGVCAILGAPQKRAPGTSQLQNRKSVGKSRSVRPEC